MASKISKSLTIGPHLLLAGAAAALAGCATYHPMPLERSAIAERLRAPDMEVVRSEVKTIRHPILKPLDFDTSNGLSPDEAAILAVLANPVLRAARDQRGLAAAQLLQAGVLPNPQLSYSLDVPIGGKFTLDTVNAYGFSLSWDVTSLITRGARVEAARAQARSVDLDIAWQEWQVAAAAKQHVIRLLFLQDQLAVERQIETGLRENLDVVSRAVELRAKTVVELAAATATLQQAQLARLATEQTHERERLALNRVLGVPSDSAISLETGTRLPSWGVLPSVGEIVADVEARRLDLLALKTGYQSQEASVRAAVLSQFPKITLGFSRAGDTSKLETAGFSVSVSLPFFDRGQGRVALQEATRTRLFDEYVARLYEARAESARLVAEMEAVRGRIAAEEAALPALEQLVSTYRVAVETRSGDILSYYVARERLFTRQVEVLKLKRALADLGSALEITAGRYVPANGPDHPDPAGPAPKPGPKR